MKINKLLMKIVKLGVSCILALVIIYFTVSISLIGFDFGYRVFTEPPVAEEPGRDHTVTIEDGMSDYEIAEELKRYGLIRDTNLFFIQLQLSAYRGEILPGKYTLNTSMEPKEMMVYMSTPQEEKTSEADE